MISLIKGTPQMGNQHVGPGGHKALRGAIADDYLARAWMAGKG